MAHVLTHGSFGTMLDNRPAAATGLLGMALVGALAGLLAYTGSQVVPDQRLDELPFTPGLILALGSPDAAATAPNPNAAPTDPAEPTENADAAEATETPEDETTPDDSVTDEAATPAPPRPPRPPRPQPSPAGGKLPPAPTPSPAPSSPGDPFGDPDGFDDLDRDGDPWARDILAALDGMKVGTVYAKPIAGTVRFQMVICKDGRVSRVSNKGGTASVDERDLVLLEVERLKVRPPPPKIAAGMKGSCAKIKHTFSWSDQGTR